VLLAWKTQFPQMLECSVVRVRKLRSEPKSHKIASHSALVARWHQEKSDLSSVAAKHNSSDMPPTHQDARTTLSVPCCLGGELPFRIALRLAIVV